MARPQVTAPPAPARLARRADRPERFPPTTTKCTGLPCLANRPIALSQGRYGTKIGVDRVLRLLARYNIETTFFVPGQVIENNKDVIGRVLDAIGR